MSIPPYSSKSAVIPNPNHPVRQRMSKIAAVKGTRQQTDDQKVQTYQTAAGPISTEFNPWRQDADQESNNI
jgi:hypothetical protein